MRRSATILLTVLASLVAQNAFGAWYDSNWSGRQKITILPSLTDADLSNFPYMVSITDTTNAVFAATRSDGFDILFTESDGTTKLAHEIEVFNNTPGNKAFVIWVKVPAVSASVDTEIYMYYGNAGASNQQNVTGVWDSNYVGVWHMHHAPNDTVFSSTGSFHLTERTGMDAGDLVDGAVGKAIEFDNSTNYLHTGSNALTLPGSFTMEAWVRPDAMDNWRTIAHVDDGAGNNYRLFTIQDNRPEFDYQDNGTEYQIAPNQSGTGWRHLVARYDDSAASNSLRGFLDGQITGNTHDLSLSSSSGPFIVGSYRWDNDGVFYDFWDGTLDEIRISNMARGEDWIEAVYRNQNSPDTYQTLEMATAVAPMAVWRQSGAATPLYNPWNGSSFGGTQTSLSAGEYRIIQGAESPDRDETIVVGVDSSGTIAGEMSDGSSWTALPALGSTTQSYWWGFDVAYEAVSGDAMVVYADGASLNYRVWNGAMWSNEQTVTEPLDGTPRQMQLAAHPYQDEMVLVVSDDSSRDYALVWNGSSWGNSVVLSSSGTGNDRTDIYVAYEQQSGDALVTYAKGTKDIYHRTWNGGWWLDEAVRPAPTWPIAADGNIRWMTLAADPGTDRIAMGALTYTNEIWFGVWSGLSWVSLEVLTETAPGTTFPAMAVAFEGTSGEAIATYGDGSTTPKYQVWSWATGWQTELSVANIGSVSNTMMLSAEPGTDAIMLAVQDDDSDINYIHWDGSNWASPYELETDTGDFKNQPFLFLWPGEAGSPPPTYTITGTIFDDISADMLADGSVGDASNPGVAGVEVYLYENQGGAPNVGDPLFLQPGIPNPATTDANGTFNFTGVPDSEFWVVVDSKTIEPVAYEATFGSGDAWAEQTYGPVGRVAQTAGASWSIYPSAGEMYGGMRDKGGFGSRSDDASGLMTGEHVARVTMSGASAANIDFGFSFNVVTNRFGGDATDHDGSANRTVQGSLRQFIQNANASAEANAMRFVPVAGTNASGGGGSWWRVSVSEALPAITDDSTAVNGTAYDRADGTTIRNTNANGPEFEIDGSGAGAADGLVLGSAQNELRALAINGFSDPDQAGVRIDGVSASTNRVAGCYIGLTAHGAASNANYHGIFIAAPSNTIGGSVAADRNIISGNTAAGIYLNSSVADSNIVVGNHIGTGPLGTTPFLNSSGIMVNGATNNTIGGTTSGERNIITGNTSYGVYFFGAGTRANVVKGNFIGVDASGSAAIGSIIGVYVSMGAQKNVIGGATAGERNVISGNTQGVAFSGAGADSNRVMGNFIGTDASGAGALANQMGVRIANGARYNEIGGSAGAGNTIAYNSGDGVSVFGAATDFNAISGNAIYSNGELGIDLEPDGVTSNDPGDSDSDANDLLNFPVITSATEVLGTADVDFELDLPPGDYRIEFFKNPSGVDTTHGEGETFVSAISISHGGAGTESFSHSFAGAAGDTLTATTTDSLLTGGYGSTSEFSAWFPVAPPSTYDISGRVFEDAVINAGTGEPFNSGEGDAGLAGARVELFDATNVFQSFTTTDGSGNYTFANLDGGAAYKIRAVAATLDAGVGALPEQTFESDGSSDYGTFGAAMGGQDPLAADTTGQSTMTGAEHWVSVSIGGADITGVDFGFSYELVVNTNDTGQGSLRRFIENANAIAGLQHSRFNIPTTDPNYTASPLAYVIRPDSALAEIIDPTIIDGTTQPDFATTPVIVLDGGQAGAGVNGLRISAGSSTVQGLAINQFTLSGIYITTTGGNTIEGNYIGTDVAGALDRGNGTHGIHIDSDTGGNTIGGTTMPKRNVISANGANGIFLQATSANSIWGNHIGTDRAGAPVLGNAGHGVLIEGGDDNAVGGTAPGEGNLISGNQGSGVAVTG